MAPLIVRLVARSPRDRLQPGKPERYALECGWDDSTADDHAIRGGTQQERGRMVCVLLERDDQVPEALHSLADLWARQVRSQANLRHVGESPVLFDIADGGRGTYSVHVEELPNWLHRMADKWGDRRAVRRAMFRHNLRAPQVARAQ